MRCAPLTTSQHHGSPNVMPAASLAKPPARVLLAAVVLAGCGTATPKPAREAEAPPVETEVAGIWLAGWPGPYPGSTVTDQEARRRARLFVGGLYPANANDVFAVSQRGLDGEWHYFRIDYNTDTPIFLNPHAVAPAAEPLPDDHPVVVALRGYGGLPDWWDVRATLLISASEIESSVAGSGQVFRRQTLVGTARLSPITSRLYVMIFDEGQ